MVGEAQREGDMKRIFLAFAITAAIVLTSTASAQNTGGGVGVLNTPPTFVSIDITEIDDHYHIEAVVSDYNGRGDIYSVDVNIIDANNNVISNFSYYQWDSKDRTTASRIDSFVDHEGGYLVREDCSIERYVGANWFLENTTITVRFVVRPLDGKTITIRAHDFRMEEAFYEGPITSKIAVQTIIQGRAIPIIISAITATLGTGAVVFDRRNKNVLAKTVRQKMEEEIG